jgi:hypothetical protein
MSDPVGPAPKTLPGWLVGLISLGVAFHCFALVVHVVAARSGPWVVPPPIGVTPVEAPPFSAPIANVVAPPYLNPLRMTHNYHFMTNRPEVYEVTFEIRLKDSKGRVTTRRKFPDPEANPWVRFRQELLAQELFEDSPVQLARGEVIPAPGQKMRIVTYWDQGPKETEMKLVQSPEHLAPKMRELYMPRQWSSLVARSYLRYLLRQNETAASAELVRYAKNPVLPENLMMPERELLEGTFTEYAANFGEVKR